jgi:hypothetical protein
MKAQEENMALLDTVLERNIRLVDHEFIRDPASGERLVAFGDYAGTLYFLLFQLVCACFNLLFVFFHSDFEVLYFDSRDLFFHLGLILFH